jgi:23S rRNA (cytidine1920-2'-O)/16S rRNA (cytidine1409-2'-O)-methyltransferase
VGKGGVVREAADRRAALVAAGEAARALGASLLGFASSGLPGPKGNRESFMRLAEAGRAGAVEDVEAAARRVEAHERPEARSRSSRSRTDDAGPDAPRR